MEDVQYNAFMPARKVTFSSSEKKPSLASLMPDKTKGIAAKKRAVNRIVASASKKTSAKKAASKLITGKKTVTKTTPVTTRKVRTKIIAKKPSSVDPVVVLPASISIRAKEKSLVILQALVRDFHVPAQKVALASGICFITFGGYMSLAFSGALPHSITPQAAQLSGTSSTMQQTTTPATTAGIITPTFTLLEPIPAVIHDVSKFTISVTNAKTVTVYLYSLINGTELDVPVDPLVEGTYRFTIDATSLEHGEYVIKTLVTSATDNSKYSFKVGEFKVEPKEAILPAPTPSQATSTALQNNVTSPKSTTTTAMSKPPVETEPVEDIKTLSIKTLGTEFSGRTVLKAYAPPTTRFVEFHARPIKSTNLRFLGLAEKRNDYWQYFFNSANLPNGTYELIAKTRINNTFLESDSTIVTISNYVPIPAPEPEVVNETKTEQSLSFEDTVAYDSENTRSFSEYTLFDAGEASSSSSTDEQSDDIDFVLDGYREELQALLERYAVAQQSGDALLIEIAKNELQGAKTRLVAEVLANPSLSILGDDIEAALSTRFEELQKRIETFEELRRVASEESSSADTDADGISDFDEFNLYRTNPEEPDSDNDGVTDGVEIMRGYNPLDATAEAVIEYELPQETFGLIENELLKVESVSPFVKTEDPTIAPVVQASIKGKGLPNSYVTIYVFSTPTIVTVRTDQDGSFEYTFEKELEDGEHEVYVAVTDNTGAIMARSNPFRFIKEAQAFTPIDAAGQISPTEMTLSDLQAFDSYNIAIGLGILALGIILLILGSGLREKNFITMTSPSNDVHAT
jgi:Bacterial Ig-like domain